MNTSQDEVIKSININDILSRNLNFGQSNFVAVPNKIVFTLEQLLPG